MGSHYKDFYIDLDAYSTLTKAIWINFGTWFVAIMDFVSIALIVSLELAKLA